jgi:CHASE2 domain-containing sensor protein
MFRKRHIIVSLIAASLSLVLWNGTRGILNMLSFLNPVERALANFHMTDLFCEAENGNYPQDTSSVITIVDMSEVFNRAELATIIEHIDNLQPAIIGVDIRFDGERDDHFGNERLIETVLNTNSPIIWANMLSNWSDEEKQFTKVLHSFFVDRGIKVEEGFTNVQHDINGGTVRSYGIKRQAEGLTYYSLPTRLAIAMTGDSTILKKYDDCNIRYSSTHFPIVPFDKITENADLIRNRIVILGAIDDKRDMHYCPIGPTSGISIIAFATNTLINDNAPKELSFGWMVLLSLFLIWFAEVMHETFLWGVSHIKWLRTIAERGILDGIYILLYLMLVLVLIDYFVFKLTSYYYDTAFIIMSILLLDTSRQIYDYIKENTSRKANFKFH